VRVMATCAGLALPAPLSLSLLLADETATDHPSIFPAGSSSVESPVPSPYINHAMSRAIATPTLKRLYSSSSSLYSPSSLLRRPLYTSLVDLDTEVEEGSSQQMDPWISSQPSLSLDLRVGLPPLSLHHQAPVAVALPRPKLLVEENFLLPPPKKEPEVRIYTLHSDPMCDASMHPPHLDWTETAGVTTSKDSNGLSP
jgi:hypothetical protein